MSSISKVYLAAGFAEQLSLGSRRYELVELLSQQETTEIEPPKREYERPLPSFY